MASDDFKIKGSAKGPPYGPKNLPPPPPGPPPSTMDKAQDNTSVKWPASTMGPPYGPDNPPPPPPGIPPPGTPPKKRNRRGRRRGRGGKCTPRKNGESNGKQLGDEPVERERGRSRLTRNDDDGELENVAQLYCKERGEAYEEPSHEGSRHEDVPDRGRGRSPSPRYNDSMRRCDEDVRNYHPARNVYRPSTPLREGYERGRPGYRERSPRYRYRSTSPRRYSSYEERYGRDHGGRDYYGRDYEGRGHNGQDYNSGAYDRRNNYERGNGESSYNGRDLGDHSSYDRYRSRSPQRFAHHESEDTVPMSERTVPKYDADGRPFHPATAYPLREYFNEVVSLHSKTHDTYIPNLEVPPNTKFKHSNGRVNPSTYGSTIEHDLGLCFGTFMSNFECEMGQQCPWRHHPLTTTEKGWIREVAGKEGEVFIANSERFWCTPDVPDPGANLWAVMKQRR